MGLGSWLSEYERREEDELPPGMVWGSDPQEYDWDREFQRGGLIDATALAEAVWGKRRRKVYTRD